MKLLFVLIVLTSQAFSGQNANKEEIRTLFTQSIENQSSAEKLLKLLENTDSNNPLFYGYKGVANIMLSKHKILPWSKWEYFQKGKEILEKAIAEAPANYELRFLRYSIQSQIPEFLDYRDKLQEDKQLLMEEFPNLKDEYLKKSVENILGYKGNKV